MITIKCKCGAQEMTFKHLSESDFPKGWFSDCCADAVAKAPKIEPEASEPQESVSEQLVEAQLQGVEETAAPEAAPEAPAEEPKRRGRRGRN